MLIHNGSISISLLAGYSGMTCPREVNEMPSCEAVLIMMPSTIGTLTGLVDSQRMMKLAPEPPALSYSPTM
jgi:hypothetical protein